METASRPPTVGFRCASEQAARVHHAVVRRGSVDRGRRHAVSCVSKVRMSAAVTWQNRQSPVLGADRTSESAELREAFVLSRLHRPNNESDGVGAVADAIGEVGSRQGRHRKRINVIRCARPADVTPVTPVCNGDLCTKIRGNRRKPCTSRRSFYLRPMTSLLDRGVRALTRSVTAHIGPRSVHGGEN
jgi:hypothetical protein